ncbi:MAG: T9SS type A sorting domain-containing protein [Bacteroidetes bacterium]|nr:T9SS type A sorting domain-containing protein [Bacteroidota bacterium]
MKKNIFLTGLLILCMVQAWAQNPKKVLIEVFTGASCKYCPAANAHVDSLVAAYPQKVQAIKYQSMPPGYDPMYLDDSADVNRLANYYHPSSFPDGLMNGHRIYPTDITQAQIDSIYAISSSFTLTLSHWFTADYDSVFVKLMIRADVALDFPAGMLHARMAMSEDSIWFFAPPGSNEEKTFYKVLKKMLPDAAGTVLRDHWLQGQLDSVIVSAPMPGTVYDFNNLSINAWVQRDDTKDILQCALSIAHKLPYYVLIDRLNSLQLAPVQCFDSLKFAEFYFTNTGTQPLTSCRLGYAVDTGPYNTKTWTGYLGPGVTTEITIPTTYIGNGMHSIHLRADYPGYQFLFPSRMTAYVNSLSVQQTAILPPLHEYFLNPGFPFPGWAVYNQSKSGTTWKWVNFPMDTTSFLLGALQLRWFIMTGGTVNELYLPAMNVSAKSSLMLTFDMVYASFGDLSHDTLKVLVSSDCGQTWNTVFSGQGSEIFTHTMDQFEWTGWLPDTNTWARHTVELSSFIGSGKLLIKFRAISNYGNDLYLRNIFVGSNLGIKPLTSSAFTIYPNPMHGHGTIEFDVNSGSGLTSGFGFGFTPGSGLLIRIITADGRVVKESRCNVQSGHMKLPLDVSGIEAGVYIVECLSDKEVVRKKVVVSR